MNFPKLHAVDFLTGLHQQLDFFEECVDKVVFTDSCEVIWSANPDPTRPPMRRVLYSVRSVIPYTEIQFRQPEGYCIRKYPSVNSYAIYLEEFPDIESFMQRQFNRKARGNIYRSLRKLEDSYTLRYKRYYGAIEKAEYLHLMELLYQMIRLRFRERGHESDTLKNWQLIHDSLYTRILDKTASLFVIYHKETPISISICYHYGRLLFYYITSYDLAYSKFSPGTFMMYRQLEWGIANKYRYFEMGYGDLDYKRWWANRVYTLYRYMIFPKNSVYLRLLNLLEGCKTSLMAFLISKKVNVYYRNLLRALRLRRTNEVVIPEFSWAPADSPGAYPDLLPIDLSRPENARFLPAIHEFLYHSRGHFSQVRLYSFPESECYLVSDTRTNKRLWYNSKKKEQ